MNGSKELHGRAEIRNYSSSVKGEGSDITLVSLRSLVKYFSTLEEKFRISALPSISTSLLQLIIHRNRPIRLTQCCTQFKPFGNKTFCFRNFHII